MEAVFSSKVQDTILRLLLLVALVANPNANLIKELQNSFAH